MRLCITAEFSPAADHATRENKYINNLVDDSEDNENTYDYLTRMQNKYNINIWFYRPSTEDGVTLAGAHKTKVEILEIRPNFVRGCKNFENTSMG